MAVALVALACGAAGAATPLEAGGTRIGTRYLGADASVLAGVDRWTGGGGPAVLTQVGLGGSWSRGGWASAVRAGSWLEVVPRSAFDGHLAAAHLQHRSGFGAVVTGSGSVSVGWGQGSALAAASATLGPLSASVSAGPVGRGGLGGEGAGGMGAVEVAVGRGAVRPALEVRGTAWALGALPHLAQAAGWVQVQPVGSLVVTPSASVIATGAGPQTPVAGLPPGEALVGRVGLAAEIGLGRTLRLQADGAWEGGPGYQRAVVFGGVGARLGRIRTRGCAAVAAGTVVLRLVAPAAAEVAVAGSFNGWAPAQMVRQGGAWTVAVPLGPGIYEYVYLVDGEAVVPPEAALTRPDGWGGTNGVIEVAEDPC